MVLLQCVNAYVAVQGMMDKEWDYRTAHALVMLRRELQPHVSYYQQQELRLVDAYAARDQQGKIRWTAEGKFLFRDPKQAEEFGEKRRELGLVEMQEEFKVRKVPAPGMIQPAVLEALEGFLEFEEEKHDRTA